MDDDLPTLQAVCDVMGTHTGQALLDGLLIAADLAETAATNFEAMGDGAPTGPVACRELAKAIRDAALELGSDQFGTPGNA